MAYRFRGRFHGAIYRMDARQRLYRKERREQSAARRPMPAQDAAKMLGDVRDVLKNPQVQQAAVAMLPRLLGLPAPPSLPMLPPPR